MKNHFILMGAICRTIHPTQYYYALQALKELDSYPDHCKEPARLREILSLWTIPFNAMQIISNRETPLHQDVQGRNEWYDILLTLGEYDNGRMVLPGLGLRLVYNPGTLVAISGKMVLHGVSRVNGDRISFAQFLRDKVMTRLGQLNAMYMNISNLL